MAVRRRTARPIPVIIAFIVAYIARQLMRVYLSSISLNPAVRLILGYLVFFAVLAGTYWLINRYTDL